jgi:hypothetical protein
VGLGLVSSKLLQPLNDNELRFRETIDFMLNPLKIELSKSITNLATNIQEDADFLLYVASFNASKDYAVFTKVIREKNLWGIHAGKILESRKITEEKEFTFYTEGLNKFKIEIIGPHQKVIPLYQDQLDEIKECEDIYEQQRQRK